MFRSKLFILNFRCRYDIYLGSTFSTSPHHHRHQNQVKSRNGMWMPLSHYHYITVRVMEKYGEGIFLNGMDRYLSVVYVYMIIKL